MHVELRSEQRPLPSVSITSSALNILEQYAGARSPGTSETWLAVALASTLVAVSVVSVVAASATVGSERGLTL